MSESAGVKKEVLLNRETFRHSLNFYYLIAMLIDKKLNCPKKEKKK